jgi:3-methyladenine DNA glycosylase AlkD
MEKILKEIHESFAQLGDKTKCATYKKFIPTAQITYGLTMPDRKVLAKHYAEKGFPLVDALWLKGSFEDRVLAAKILALLAKKQPNEVLTWIEQHAKDITDWVVCDTIGMQCSKPMMKKFQEQLFDLANRKIKSPLLWERRLALVLVECYCKNEHLHPRINSLITQVKNDKEYYVKKAIQWLERNMKKKKGS